MLVAGLLSLLKLGVLVLTTGAVGARLLRRLEADERPVAGFALGMGLLSTLTGLLLLLRVPAFWILATALAAGLAWARREAVAALRGALAWMRAGCRGSAGDRAHALLVVAVGILGVIGCWAPATGWDTGVYHFSLARLRAEEGWWVVRPDIPYSYMPAGMESLYTVGFLFDGERLASLINFAFYFAGFGLVRVWGARAGGDTARMFAGLAYLTSITYALRLDGGDVEVGQAVYLGLGLYALWRLREGAPAGVRIGAGIAFGFALAVKYSMLWALAAWVVVWAVVRWRDRRPWREILADLVVVGATAALVASPCYLRNLVLTGNPVFPLLDPVLNEVFESQAKGWDGNWRGLGFIRLDALVLAVVPSAWMAVRVRLRWMVWVVGLYCLVLLRHTGLTEAGIANALRFASPAFLPLWVLIGAALAALSGWRRWSGVALVGLLLALCLVVQGERNRRKLAVAVGWKSREAYLQERINSRWALRRAEAELPAGKKVLLVELRSYYCGVPFVEAADSQRFVDFEKISAAEQFRDLLARHSIGLIVYSHAPEAKTYSFARLLSRVPGILDEAGVLAVETRNNCTLYRVQD